MRLPGAPDSVRDADGVVDPALETQAITAHAEFRRFLETTGRIPVGGAARDGEAGTRGFGGWHAPLVTASATEPADVTLRHGFDVWLDLDGGRYAAKTKRWKTIEHAARVLCEYFGPSTPWRDIRQAELRRYGREMGKAAAARDGGGLRRTEIIIDAFYSVGAWLRQHEHLPPAVGLAPPAWRRVLRDDWLTIFGVSGHDLDVRRPRHTPEELYRIFKALDDPRVDPRIALLVELAAEQRLGQAVRAMRRDLELGPVRSVGRTPDHGMLRIRGVGRKRAAPIVLSATQRERLDAALTTGYLHELEAAFLRGEVTDYPLFPARHLRRRVIPFIAGDTVRPVGPERVRDMFNVLEQVAGVEHVPHRGWYGLRRVATDLAQDHSKDERVLNAITGHSESRTRETIYQQPHRVDDLREAAVVRERLRGRAGRDATAASDAAETEWLEGEIARLQTELAARRARRKAT
jgi:hypothetical protein